MSEPIEFAPLYSRNERLTKALPTLAIAALLYWLYHSYFHQWLTWYLETMHCHQFFSLTGIEALWLAIFVGIPMLCAITIAIALLPTGYNTLKDKQYPPIGAKVFQKTKIVKGNKARIKGWMHLLLPLIFVAIACWGYLQVGQMPTDADGKLDPSLCVDQAIIIQ